MLPADRIRVVRPWFLTAVLLVARASLFAQDTNGKERWTRRSWILRNASPNVRGPRGNAPAPAGRGGRRGGL
jgi:hypothetical protein